MALPSSMCQQCPLYDRLPYFVGSDGPEDAEVVFVGEAPGEREVAQHKPFVGPAGIMFNELIAKAGFDRTKVKVTNALKCRPKDNKLPADLQLALDCCSEILLNDIRNAKVVVGLGGVPLQALTGFTGITKRRGSLYKLENGATFAPTLHPSFLRRSSFVKKQEGKETKAIPKEVVIHDLKRARKIAEGMAWEVEENYILEPTPDQFVSFLEELYKPRDLVGVDIETTWGKVREVIPLIIAFSLPEISIVASYEDDLEFIVDALMSPTPKTFHNGIFDGMVQANLGIPVVNYSMDSLYGHHTLWAELPHSLGFVQSVYTTMPFHKHMKDELEEAFEK